MEAILNEWDRFAAAQLPAAGSMNAEALRDHAEEILRAVAKDILTPQSVEEQSRKSKGRVLRAVGAPETAAETHAFLRAASERANRPPLLPTGRRTTLAGCEFIEQRFRGGRVSRSFGIAPTSKWAGSVTNTVAFP